VWGDEGEHHRIEPPDQDRAAVRQVVGGRALRRRADEPVAALRAELLVVDRIAELDDAADRPAGDHDVVDGDVRRAVRRHLERRQLDHAVAPGEHALQVAFQPVGCDRGQEADAAVIDADHRHAGAEEARERPQHRAVAAEHDRNVRFPLALEELHSEPLRKPPQTLDRRFDELRLAVGDQRGTLNRRHR